MDIAAAAVAIALATLAMNLIVNIKGGSWKLADRFSTLESKIMAAVNAHKSAVDNAVERMRLDVQVLREEIESKIDESEVRFGETVLAMQNKIHEFEKWSRDEFVRKESFGAVLTRIETGQSERDRDMRERLVRLENLFVQALKDRRGQVPPGYD